MNGKNSLCGLAVLDEVEGNRCNSFSFESSAVKLLFCLSHPYRTGEMMKKESWRMKKGWKWITKRRLPLGHHGVHKSLYCQGSRRDNTIRQSIKHLHRLLQGYSGVSTPKSKFGSIFIASSKQSANLHWLLAMN